MAIWGYEANFVLIASVAYSILYAIISFSKAGKKLFDSKDMVQKVEAKQDCIQKLENLKKLYDAEILTDEEFQTQKDKIWGGK